MRLFYSIVEYCIYVVKIRNIGYVISWSFCTFGINKYTITTHRTKASDVQCYFSCCAIERLTQIYLPSSTSDQRRPLISPFLMPVKYAIWKNT